MSYAPLTMDRLANILSSLRQELEGLLGSQLDAIYLYGSQARGDAHPESDIDVLIVLRGDFDYFEMIEKTAGITAQISLENDIVISSAFTTVDNFQHLRTPFLINVRREGVQV